MKSKKVILSGILFLFVFFFIKCELKAQVLTVTIDQAIGQADPTITSPINFTAVFSRAVNGFTGSDISFAGSTVTGALSAVVTGGPVTYNVAVSGMTGNGIVRASIPASVCTAVVGGNANQASTSTDFEVTYFLPTLSVTIDQAVGQADPTNNSPINYKVVFSRDVTGFTASDISFNGSTVSGTLSAVVTGGPVTFNVAVSGMASSGIVRASIPASVCTAVLGGNTNQASTSTDFEVTYNLPPLTVTIDQAVGQFDPTSNSPINFTAVFSRAVNGFTASDISFAGSTASGTLSAVVTGGPVTFNVAVSGMTSSGIVRASIPASVCTAVLGGNTNQASTSTDFEVTYNLPPLTVTIDQAVGQFDPTSNSPINFTAEFSRDVTGFTASDISFAGSTVNGTLSAVLTGGPAKFNVAVSGMVGNGTVVASVPAGSAAAVVGGNTNATSTSADNTVNYTFPVAVSNQSINNNIKVYPTLITSNCIIKLDGTNFLKAYKMVNTWGGIVKQQEFELRRELVLNCSDLPNGIYILQLKTSNGIYSYQLYKQ